MSFSIWTMAGRFVSTTHDASASCCWSRPTRSPGTRRSRAWGPEPLDDAFDGSALAERLKGRRTPIKAALLDQKTLVGVGNIYACEALFLSGISPRRSAHAVQGDRAARLATAIKQVLSRSIDDGGSTLRDHIQPGG
jgi:formamidopyrimidine-DNA glycosylase